MLRGSVPIPEKRIVGETLTNHKADGSLLQRLVIYSASAIYHCELEAMPQNLIEKAVFQFVLVLYYNSFIPKNMYSFVSPRNKLEHKLFKTFLSSAQASKHICHHKPLAWKVLHDVQPFKNR